jgi:tRNA A-37 threonylcarbamoyl transferase component Bud32
MPEWTAEQLSQRMFDLRVLDARQLESVWADMRTRDVSCEDFKNHLLRKQLVTNFQLEKVLKGERDGYFYGKYRVLYIVGTGTFARVYRAVHAQTDRVVAVKVLRRRYRTEPEQVELFLREARMGERLRHVNIVRIYDVSDDVRAPYMVMEFVEGWTLRELLKRRKKLDVPTSLSLIVDVVSGLDYARKMGVTHRDLKLSNVLVTSTGRAKLVDFGLATITESDDKLLTADPNARAIDYVALERGTGVRKNDHRSDIYFAGCILYNMLTGVMPLFETRDRLLRMNVSRFEQIKPVAELEPDLPLSVAAVVNRAMCFQPLNRYQEFEDMLADLTKAKAYLDGGGKDAAEAREAEAGSSAAGDAAGQEGAGRTLMLVESQAELQNTLRQQLKKRGYRMLITSDPVRAITRLEDDFRAAHCVIFSTQELGVDALQAFNKLGELEATANIPAILLVDQRLKGAAKAAKTAPHRVLLPMPLRLKELLERLQILLADDNPA